MKIFCMKLIFHFENKHFVYLYDLFVLSRSNFELSNILKLIISIKNLHKNIDIISLLE